MSQPVIRPAKFPLQVKIFQIFAITLVFVIGSLFLPQKLSHAAPTQQDALTSRVRSELKVFTDWLQKNNVKGFIGEVGWPDDAKGDQGEWNAVADAWYQDADASDLWVTAWATGEWWGSNYILGIYEDRLSPAGVDTANTQAAVLEAHASKGSLLRGVNVAGADFGTDGGFSNSNLGVYDVSYHYDGIGTFQYLASRGVKLVRLPFRWERIQPKLGQSLDQTELLRLKTTVNRAKSAGLKVILDLHNYAKYSGTPIGGGISNEQLSDLWRRLSNEFKNDPEVLYGLMNEPEGLSGYQVWQQASQAALSAIRTNGDSNTILVPGYNWSGVQRWTENNPTPWITDPMNNFRYEAHHYWDRDNSGDYPDTYASEVSEAQQRGYKGDTVTNPTNPSTTVVPNPTLAPVSPPTTTPTVSQERVGFSSSINDVKSAAADSTIVLPVKVKSGGDVQNYIVDVEVRDSADQLVFQEFYEQQSFKLGETKSYNPKWITAGLPAGSYKVSVGVFQPNWNSNEHWNNVAATIALSSSSGTVVKPINNSDTSGYSTSILGYNPSPIKPGDTVIIGVQIQSPIDVEALVDLEIYNSAGEKIGQSFLDNQTLQKNTTQRFSFNWEVPANLPLGSYTLKVGVFGPQWSSLLHWNDNAALMTLSEAPTGIQTATGSGKVVGTSAIDTIRPDFGILIRDYGKKGPSIEGDINKDGTVDMFDFATYFTDSE